MSVNCALLPTPGFFCVCAPCISVCANPSVYVCSHSRVPCVHVRLTHRMRNLCFRCNHNEKNTPGTFQLSGRDQCKPVFSLLLLLLFLCEVAKELWLLSAELLLFTWLIYDSRAADAPVQRHTSALKSLHLHISWGDFLNCAEGELSCAVCLKQLVSLLDACQRNWCCFPVSPQELTCLSACCYLIAPSQLRWGNQV